MSADFEQLKVCNHPLQTEQEQLLRIKEHQDYLAQQKVKFDERKRAGKETYFISSDSMKCLICGKSLYSPVSIKVRWCMYCDIFHDEEDDQTEILKRVI